MLQKKQKKTWLVYPLVYLGGLIQGGFILQGGVIKKQSNRIKQNAGPGLSLHYPHPRASFIFSMFTLFLLYPGFFLMDFFYKIQ